MSDIHCDENGAPSRKHDRCRRCKADEVGSFFLDAWCSRCGWRGTLGDLNREMREAAADTRARAIHAVVCDAARARSKPFTSWDQLPLEKRERLIAVAERLNLEYGAAGDPPSAGIPADDPVVEVSP